MESRWQISGACHLQLVHVAVQSQRNPSKTSLPPKHKAQSKSASGGASCSSRPSISSVLRWRKTRCRIEVHNGRSGACPIAFVWITGGCECSVSCSMTVSRAGQVQPHAAHDLLQVLAENAHLRDGLQTRRCIVKPDLFRCARDV